MFQIIHILFFFYVCHTLQASVTNNFSTAPDIISQYNDQLSTSILETVKQPIIEQNLYSFNTAKIRILNQDTGINNYKIIKLNVKSYINKQTFILLKQCKKNNVNRIASPNIALIFVGDNKNIIYNNWIVSKNTAAGMPYIDKHYIYLVSCYNEY